MALIRIGLVLDTVLLSVGLYGYLSGVVLPTTPTVLAAVFSFLGVNLLLGGFHSYGKTRRWLAASLQTTGEVTGHLRRESVEGMGDDEHRSVHFHPTVRFLTATGQVVSFTSSVGSSTPGHAVGQRIGVRYQVDDPHSARVDEFFSIWLVPVVLLGLGGPFLLAALGLCFSAQP